MWRLLLLPACLLAGAVGSVLAGQDANWDLLNYHLYNGYALLHGRFDQDLLAAGMQSSLNPLPDVPYAWLALGPLNAHPRLLAAAMGLPWGALLFLAVRVGSLLGPGRLLPATGAVLGCTGVSAVAQLGTTTNEIPVAAIMLGGLLLLLRNRAGWGGLLFGLAAGLKLTATAFAPAAGLALLARVPPRRWPVAAPLFAATWCAGLLATDGWWAATLWSRFGSPAFPMFNGVFRSPLFPPASLLDDRFIPRGLLQWLVFPAQWLLPGGPTPGELPVHDPRLLLGLLAALTLLALFRRVPPEPRAAAVFLLAGYVTWLGTSSIIRYAVVLEVVAGLLIPIALARLAGRRTLPALAAAVLVATLTRYPATARVPYGDRAFAADMGWVRPGTLLVVTFRGPTAHVLAALPHADNRALNLGDTVLAARGWPLHDHVEALVRDHPGPIVVLTQGNHAGRFPELAEIGLASTITGCRPVPSTFVPASPTGIHACHATRQPRTRLPSPFWAQAASRYRALYQPRDAAMSLAGASFLDAAGPAARGTRITDWTDLLWHGVRGAGAPLPARIDPGILYVLAPEHLPAMQALRGPDDALGLVDGLLVLAPGWREAPLLPVRVPLPGTPLRPGDVVPLGPAAAASGLLGAGWWPPDPGGSWSGAEATLRLPLTGDMPTDAMLLLSGRVFTAPPLPTQRLVLDVPGHPESETTETLAGDGTVRFPLRPEWRAPDGSLALRLRLPDAASPHALGLSPDPRPLGLSLTGLALLPP